MNKISNRLGIRRLGIAIAFIAIIFSALSVPANPAYASEAFKRIRVVNFSGEDIAYILQITPGCGHVRAKFPFVCHYKKLVKKGAHDDYKPDAGIDAARWSQTVGVGILGIGVGMAAGSVTGGIGGAATSVAYTAVVKGIKEDLQNREGLPQGAMILTVFPKGKVGRKKNQVRCVVPPGKSTIFIGPPKRGAKGKTERFTCSLAPPDVIFAGKIVNLKKQGRESICLTYNFEGGKSKQRLKMEKCRRRQDQVWYLYDDGTLKNGVDYKHCFGFHSSKKLQWLPCKKNGRAQYSTAKWAFTDKGRLENTGMSKSKRQMLCLQPENLKAEHNRTVFLKRCSRADTSPNTERWTPNGRKGAITRDFLALNSAGTMSIQQGGHYYKRVHIHNASGEDIALIFQYRPGCARVIRGYTFGCHFRKKIKNGKGTVYKPDTAGWIAADWIQEIGTTLASSAAGAIGKHLGKAYKGATGSLGQFIYGKLGAAGGSLTAFSIKQVSKFASQAAAPQKLLTLRVFPAGKVKLKNNHAFCLVPITDRTINILPKKPNAPAVGGRFDCVVAAN